MNFKKLSYSLYMVLKLLFYMFLFVLLVLPELPSSVRAAGILPVVMWMHADAPPFHIVEGPYAGQGHSDMLHHLLGGSLREFKHVVITASLPRTFSWIRDGSHVLAVNLVATEERRRGALFSDPSLLCPPVCLVIRAGDEQRLHVSRPVQLRQFIREYRLCVAVGRSYGHEVDSLVNETSRGARLTRTCGSKLLENQLEMLRLGRVDGLLAFPMEIAYFASLYGQQNAYTVLPIREAMLPIVLRIAAPRTPWGADMISRINMILAAHRNDATYQAAFERWLPADYIPEYRSMSDRYFSGR